MASVEGVVRAEPRISVNKLAEYMVARPVRRRAIVRDQKRPPEFLVARYTEAQDAIVKYFTAGQDDTVILEALRSLETSEPRSEWDAQRLLLCAEALDAFLEIPEFPFMAGMRAVAGHPQPELLDVAGVAVSVRPEVLLTGIDRQGRPISGAIKLYIGKTVPLTDDSGAFAATILYQYLETYPPGNLEPDPKHAVVVDVFARRMFPAPRSYQRRRNDVVAACEEIARAWATA